MANTWIVVGKELNTNTMSTSKGWVYLYNGESATRVLRVYRIYVLNIQTAAITGVLATLELRKYTGSPTLSGTAITPNPADTANSALEASVSAGSNVTPSGGSSSIIRRWIWSTDEPTVATTDLDMFQTFPVFSKFFDVIGSYEMQPLVLRAGEAVVVYCSAASGTLAGLIDVVIEFTDEAT